MKITSLGSGVYLAIGIFFLLGAVLGYSLSFLRNTQPTTPTSQPEVNVSTVGEINKLFIDQTALISGTITALNDKTATIKSRDNAEATIELNDQVYITDSSTGRTNRPASATADLKEVQLNKPALITAKFVDGKYKIATIVYTPPVPSSIPLPSVRPVASPAATNP